MPHHTSDKKQQPNKIERRKPEDAVMQEMRLGKLVVSFFPKGTIVIRVGDDGEMTMFSAPDAERLMDFLRKYLESYKTK